MTFKPKRRNKAKANKQLSRETPVGTFGDQGKWKVLHGELERRQGRPGKTARLFSALAEKLPKDSLGAVCKDLCPRLERQKLMGVYVAHDSMGYPRYIGRGDIKGRLTARFKKQTEELAYYSFYVVEDRVHEREIETLLIRAAGPLLHFNERKKCVGIEPGSIKDFEVGTIFYERHYAKRGARPSRKGRRLG